MISTKNKIASDNLHIFYTRNCRRKAICYHALKTTDLDLQELTVKINEKQMNFWSVQIL